VPAGGGLAGFRRLRRGSRSGKLGKRRRSGIDGRDALVAKWPGLAGGKTRAVAMSSSDGNGAFASAVLGKGFPFITAAGL
jgi:hypothetical protein